VIILTNRANSSSPKRIRSANESKAVVPQFRGVVEANWLKSHLRRAEIENLLGGACPQTPLVSACFARTLYAIHMLLMASPLFTCFLQACFYILYMHIHVHVHVQVHVHVYICTCTLIFTLLLTRCLVSLGLEREHSEYNN